MRVRLPVVLVTLPIQIERQLRDLLVGQFRTPRIEDLPACRFLGPSMGGLPQALLDGVELRILEAVATHPSGVKHAQSRDCLESFVVLRPTQRVSSPAADAKKAQPRVIDTRRSVDEVRHSV